MPNYSDIGIYTDDHNKQVVGVDLRENLVKITLEFNDGSIAELKNTRDGKLQSITHLLTVRQGCPSVVTHERVVDFHIDLDCSFNNMIFTDSKLLKNIPLTPQEPQPIRIIRTD